MNRFGVFLSVGVAAAIVYFGLLALLLEVLKLDYRWSVSFAYLCAIAVHFALNRNVTFRSGEGNILRQAVRYGFMALTNYLLTILIVFFVVDAIGYSAYAGAALSLVVTTVLTFVVFKMWVFGHGERPDG